MKVDDQNFHFFLTQTKRIWLLASFLHPDNTVIAWQMHNTHISLRNILTTPIYAMRSSVRKNKFFPFCSSR